LIVATFQAEVGDCRWMTTTVAGLFDPILIFACASNAAMGMPTIPGPTTAIFCTFQLVK
jgi:hypothetical protein